MKKLLIAALLFVGTFSFANAQSRQKPETKKQMATAAVTAKSKTASTAKVEVKSSSSSHLKADGTPDKRYKENKTKAATAGPLKKNGTPDMRYKANKKK